MPRPGTDGPDCFSLTVCGDAMPGGRLLGRRPAWPVPLNRRPRFAYHCPSRGVVIPRAFRAFAIWCSDVAPARRIARMMGGTSRKHLLGPCSLQRHAP